MGWGNEATRTADLKRWHAERQKLTAERDAARAAVTRVQVVLDHARKISPSQSMTVYVADVQAAIDGAVVALPHKLGAEQ